MKEIYVHHLYDINCFSFSDVGICSSVCVRACVCACIFVHASQYQPYKIGRFSQSFLVKKEAF